MTSHDGAEHSFSAENVCVRCGRTRVEAARDGATCDPSPPHAFWPPPAPAPALEPPPVPAVRTEPPPPPPPKIVLLARPLEIVSATGPDAPELGALLISAGDRTRVAGGVLTPAASFDPDETFRVLDARRSLAETVYGWVVDGLSQAQLSSSIAEPEPTPRGIPARAVPAGVSLALVAWIVLMPEAQLLLAAPNLYMGTITLLMLGLVVSAGAVGCFWAVFLFLVAFALAFELGTQPWANRAFLGILATAVVFAVHQRARGWWRSAKKPDAHAEYVLAPGEAVGYHPELCTVGTMQKLSVSIQCTAEDGRVLRQVVLPVEGVAREDAETAARAALAPDLEHARKRLAREAEDEARRIAQAEREVELAVQREAELDARRATEAEAAEAIERLTDLERSRRSLPE